MTNLLHKHYKYIFPVLTVLVLVGGLFIGIRLSRERQDLTPRATVGAGAATLTFSGPASVDLGSSLPINLNIHAPETISDSTTDGIIGVTAIVNFDNTRLSLTRDQISENNLPGWTYVRREVNASGNTSTAVVQAIYLNAGVDGYVGSAGSPQSLVTLTFGTVAAGTTNLDFDVSQSDIRSKDNSAVMSTSLPGASYTVNSENEPTPTTDPGAPTATPEPTQVPGEPTHTPNPNPTPTSAPGTGPTNSCGGTCGSNANCNAGLTCYAGFCRNPACQTVSSCNCPGPTATPTPRPNNPTATPVPNNPTPTTSVITYVEPTIASDNPFLGGPARTNLDVPEMTYETEVPVQETWWEALMRIIRDFFRLVFGFR